MDQAPHHHIIVDNITVRNQLAHDIVVVIGEVEVCVPECLQSLEIIEEVGERLDLRAMIDLSESEEVVPAGSQIRLDRIV